MKRAEAHTAGRARPQKKPLALIEIMVLGGNESEREMGKTEQRHKDDPSQLHAAKPFTYTFRFLLVPPGKCQVRTRGLKLT